MLVVINAFLPEHSVPIVICMPVISTNAAVLQASSLVFNKRPDKSCISSREHAHAVLC